MINDTFEKTIALYAQGLRYYKSKEFETALNHFEKALFVNPKDGPSNTMAKRCRDYISQPPSSNWNGVFKITSK